MIINYPTMHHDAVFSECLDSVVNQLDATVVAQHRGDFSQEFVYELSEQVESVLFESGESKSVIKKVFSVLIEGLQNIRIHGYKREDLGDISFFILSKSETDYIFFFSNLINNKGKAYVEKAINFINKKSPAELKEYYLEQLSNGKMTEKGGGGLGFITLGLKSSSPLEYNIIPIEDDLSLFTLRMMVRHVKQ